MNPMWRLGLRLAYSCARVFWWLRQPHAYGAALVVSHGERLLVVSQSYRPGLDFPGGGRAFDEPAVTAACREAFEEVGIIVTPKDVTFLGSHRFHSHGRTISLEYFGWRPSEKPTLRLDGREIVDATWLSLAALRARRLSLGLAHYVSRHGDEIDNANGKG